MLCVLLFPTNLKQKNAEDAKEGRIHFIEDQQCVRSPFKNAIDQAVGDGRTGGIRDAGNDQEIRIRAESVKQLVNRKAERRWPDEWNRPNLQAGILGMLPVPGEVRIKESVRWVGVVKR